MRQALGKSEVWRSLSTDSIVVAKRRAYYALNQIEVNFEEMREELRRQAPSTLLKP
ncbi:DUF6538 domain-containing protein, partial [Bradyrhizobium cosmicum]|uniref:DUF6538 domain-containing protein n=1 Tax=Bradyrhizobium cosmicum TaxID=1404864 RepID=UPI0039657A79